jgi:hypothetical protein
VCWIAGDLLADAATTSSEKLIGISLLYTGVITMPALWWTIALHWAGDVGARLALRSPAWRWVPLGWAAAMWLAMITNPWHGHFLTPVVGDRNLYQPLWFAMAVPNYALILAALAVEISVAR